MRLGLPVRLLRRFGGQSGAGGGVAHFAPESCAEKRSRHHPGRGWLCRAAQFYRDSSPCGGAAAAAPWLPLRPSGES